MVALLFICNKSICKVSLAYWRLGYASINGSSLYSEKPEKTYVSVLLALKVNASSRRSTLTNEGESYGICRRKIGVKITEQFLSCSVSCFKAASGSTWVPVGVVCNDDGARTTTSIDSHYSSSFWISWLASPSFGSATAPADGTLITVSVLCGRSAFSIVKRKRRYDKNCKLYYTILSNRKELTRRIANKQFYVIWKQTRSWELFEWRLTPPFLLCILKMVAKISDRKEQYR